MTTTLAIRGQRYLLGVRMHGVMVKGVVGCMLLMLLRMLLIVLLMLLLVLLMLVMLLLMLLVMLMLVMMLLLVLLVVCSVRVPRQVVRVVRARVLLLHAYLVIQNGLLRLLLVVVAHIVVAGVLIMVPVLIN